MIVSVIISNRNDLAMLGVTVRSALEELSPFGNDGEVIVCDNSEPDYKEPLKGIIPAGYFRDHKVELHHVELHHQNFPCLFTAREMAANKAKGKYIVCVDSHMLLGHNMITDMVEFMERKGPEVGFAHAPISWAHHHESRAKHDRDVSTHELGPWGGTYDHEAKITWKGIPWICRREWFLGDLGAYGALSRHKLSWGGGDMHIGYKPWLLGFENWAVPCRPGIHLGPFPSLAGGKAPGRIPENKYRHYAQSGKGATCLGFLVSCFILGGEDMMRRNEAVITKRFGKYLNVKRQWEKAMTLGKEEQKWLRERQVVSFEDLLANPPWARIPTNPKHHAEIVP